MAKANAVRIAEFPIHNSQALWIRPIRTRQPASKSIAYFFQTANCTVHRTSVPRLARHAFGQNPIQD